MIDAGMPGCNPGHLDLGQRIARELTEFVRRRDKSGMIVSDHGTEFTSNTMLAWSQEHQITWNFVGMRNEFRNERPVFRPRPFAHQHWQLYRRLQ